MKRLILFLSRCSVAFLIIVLCVYCSTRKRLSTAELQACKQTAQDTKEIINVANTTVKDITNFEKTIFTQVAQLNTSVTLLGFRDAMMEDFSFYSNQYSTQIAKGLIDYGTCNTQLYDNLAPIVAQKSQLEQCDAAYLQIVYNDLPAWIIQALLTKTPITPNKGYVIANIGGKTIQVYSDPSYKTLQGTYVLGQGSNPVYNVPNVCTSLKIALQNNTNWFKLNY